MDDAMEFSGKWIAPSQAAGNVTFAVVTSRGPPNVGATVLSGPHADLFIVNKLIFG
eukprot:CAMPEP_0185279858 /NCGR_PEP_ID=MMETSP1359-20130426/64607_1 /TAXON_ID=552665 /ORGANISM="Bigelowiella longifila, Strain CCMP242" /LENGTH=55 /DNA_ID=CAMNT_0027874869 /DNA_START=1 /DNA_END=164 /DNA_ORIENTATION=+